VLRALGLNDDDERLAGAVEAEIDTATANGYTADDITAACRLAEQERAKGETYRSPRILAHLLPRVVGNQHAEQARVERTAEEREADAKATAERRAAEDRTRLVNTIAAQVGNGNREAIEFDLQEAHGMETGTALFQDALSVWSAREAARARLQEAASECEELARAET